MGNKSHTKTRYINSGTSHAWNGVPLKQSMSWKEQYVRVADDSPKFHSVIKSGGNATNAMTVTDQKVVYRRPNCSVIYIKKDGSGLTGQIAKTSHFSYAFNSQSNLPPASLRTSVQNSALIGIIKKIREHETSGFSGPTFLGELRETIKMIKSPLSALRQRTGLFTNLQMRINRDREKRGTREKQKLSKDISDTYLEWAFGAAPLIGDIGEIAMLALRKVSSRPSNSLRRLSFTYTDGYVQELGSDLAVWTGTGVRVYFNKFRNCESSWNYVVWVNEETSLPEAQLGFLANAAKFDLTEIVPTLYNLAPFSFLLDYFSNIGDVLGCTYDYNRNVQFGKTVSRDITVEFHDGFQVASGQPDVYTPFEFVPWRFESTYKRVVRSKLGTLGFPHVQFSLPNLGQVTNIIALFESLRSHQPSPMKGRP